MMLVCRNVKIVVLLCYCEVKEKRCVFCVVVTEKITIFAVAFHVWSCDGKPKAMIVGYDIDSRAFGDF